MEGGATAMGTHYDEVVCQFVRVCHDAAGYLIDFVGVYMAVDPDTFRKGALCELLQVAFGILRILQVGLAVHLIGCVSFHDVHEGDTCLKLFGQQGGCRQRGFGQQGTINRNKYMLEHGITRELLSCR